MPSAMSVDWGHLPEKFWHCYVKLVGSKAIYADGIANDLTLEQIRREVVEAWLAGRPFSVSGTVVRSASEVSRIKVVQTAYDQRHYADKWEADMTARGVTDSRVNLRIIPFWPENSIDYTNEFLFGEALPVPATPPEAARATAARAFVVHGHDTAMLNDVASLLERLEVESVILKDQPKRGGTLVEKVEQNSDVPYAIILFTPDDEGRAKGAKDLKLRPRQNAVLELGYFIGLLGREHVCALMAEGLDMPSAIDGVGYIPIDSQGAWHLKLAKEMRTAGLPVDLNKLASR